MSRTVATLDLSRSALGLAACAARLAADRLSGRPRRRDWSFATEAVARLLKDEIHRSRNLDLQALRAHLDRFAFPALPADRVPIRRASLGGVQGWRLDPPGAPEEAALLYLHGGGYVFGSIKTHGAFVSALARRAGLRTWFPEYRLAPEHPFPAALEDARAAYLGLLGSGQAPERLALAGESAGGGLALGLLLSLRKTGSPLPACAALISPWVDHTFSGGSIALNEPYDFADRALAERWSAAYLAGADPRHPLASPLFADLAGLPPLLVQVGGAELLHDEVEELVAKARAQGAEVAFTDWPGMFHVWQFAQALLPSGAQATDELARFLRDRVATNL